MSIELIFKLGRREYLILSLIVLAKVICVISLMKNKSVKLGFSLLKVMNDSSLIYRHPSPNRVIKEPVNIGTSHPREVAVVPP
jgi:hypothetical protein